MSNQKVFFTADTHWGHENVIEFDTRPFMSEYILYTLIIIHIASVFTQIGIKLYAVLLPLLKSQQPLWKR